ncbi:threonine aldolase family protein [Chiayiivirga sp.]|jgi:threonine aldolase|uniref:threonine aldolase family protein n=1 Tax=Chiayiivirga sp. TaxID=2041042 RepID=UPI0025BA320B|nr:beta-eliminating lyase-related protein [Chiayiivirga sp.]
MDRRGFLACGSALATATAFAPAAASANKVPAPAERGSRVNFIWDGLGLNPNEYAAQLQQAVAARDFAADYYSLGGAIAALEQKFAAVLGKEAAMFVPTGTLANHLAVRKLAGNNRRVLVQAESHLYNDSGDCAQVLSGLNLIPLAAGGTITLAEIEAWIQRSGAGRVTTPVGAISIENPVRRQDHQQVDFDELLRISSYARERGIRLHLDGARLFSLPLHSGKSVKEYAALFDSVYVSLWKHFNAASGAILAGDASFIEGLFHQRRMFGGSLPYAWPQAAVAAHHVDGFEAEYAAAWKAVDSLIGMLEASGRFAVRKLPQGTSRFFLKPLTGDAVTLAERARAQGVELAHLAPGVQELPLQVNPSVLRMPVEALARVLIEAAGD